MRILLMFPACPTFLSILALACPWAQWEESLIASLRVQPHAVFSGAGLRLDGNTVANLELLRNSHNGTQEGGH